MPRKLGYFTCTCINNDLIIVSVTDGLTSPLPALSASTLKRPPRAVPPNMPLWGSLSFLRGLSRVTLPTASLSNLIPPTHPFDPSDDSQSPGATIYLQHSPPERSSLEALHEPRNRKSAVGLPQQKHITRVITVPAVPVLNVRGTLVVVISK